MKKIGLWIVACMILLCGVSCKSKQSAYKAAYEQAKERPATVETAAVAPVQEEPVSKSKTITPVTRQEKITPVAGEDVSSIKLFSVVVGSFRNKTNALSLKERMQKDGYMPVLGENDQGMLRVILTSHESRRDAEESRAAVTRKYYPNFQDAWILERQY